MKKTISVFLILCTALFCLSGCKKNTEKKAEGYTFTDDLGRTVTVSSHQRVAALLGSYADIWMLSGGDICAAADDAWEDFSLPLSPDTVNLGSTHSISKDVLLASAPDLVLASSKLSGHLELQETLDACNITAAYFDVSDFDSYLRVLKICTDITENENRRNTCTQCAKACANRPCSACICLKHSCKEQQRHHARRNAQGFRMYQYCRQRKFLA